MDYLVSHSLENSNFGNVMQVGGLLGYLRF